MQSVGLHSVIVSYFLKIELLQFSIVLKSLLLVTALKFNICVTVYHLDDVCVHPYYRDKNVIISQYVLNYALHTLHCIYTMLCFPSRLGVAFIQSGVEFTDLTFSQVL